MIELQKNKETETTVKSTKIEKHSAKCTARESYQEYFKCIAEKVGQKIQNCDQWKRHCKDIFPDLICDSNNEKCQAQLGNSDQNSNMDSYRTSNMKSRMSQEDPDGIDPDGNDPDAIDPDAIDPDRSNNAVHCFKFCTIPQAINFTQSDSDEVNYCTKGADAGCVIEIIQANRKYYIDKMDGSSTMCPHPCHIIDYGYSKTINSIPSSKHGETWYIMLHTMILDDVL